MATVALAMTVTSSDAFSPEMPRGPAHLNAGSRRVAGGLGMMGRGGDGESSAKGFMEDAGRLLSTGLATATFGASLVLGVASPALAENELSAKYGGKGFDSSLVDQNCLVDKCSLQAQACLADDPSCRKGLTCTAKCLGDNTCITGCFARYGNKNLDNLLKCTVEDNNCIKIAILDGGADAYGSEPKPPAPTVQNFKLASMEGAWYKVAGFNPNYDCYACQRNTFSAPENGNELQMDVEFSMPRMLPDGSPPPPENKRESLALSEDGSVLKGSQSIGLNDYSTHETMVFDSVATAGKNKLTLKDSSYSRTAHSEGEMFGLSKFWFELRRSKFCVPFLVASVMITARPMPCPETCPMSYPLACKSLPSFAAPLPLRATEFWENWYVIGENDADQPEFKFVYYNGKTRQNTYEGAFVYSRARELDPAAMAKVYQIASDAGMNPDQFCKIRNGCFGADGSKLQDRLREEQAAEDARGGDAPGSNDDPFRGFLASTRVSQLLGVEPVAAEFERVGPVPASEDAIRDRLVPSERTRELALSRQPRPAARSWIYNVGDYLENPHRHFAVMDGLRLTMDWPEEVKARQ